MERKIIKIDVHMLVYIYLSVFFIAGEIGGIVVGAVGLTAVLGVILIGSIVYNTKKEKVCCFYDQLIPKIQNSHNESWQAIKDDEH